MRRIRNTQDERLSVNVDPDTNEITVYVGLGEPYGYGGASHYFKLDKTESTKLRNAVKRR